jgi:esterase
MSPALLHHRVAGNGPPLLILHGLFGSGTNWRSIARALARCRTVYLPDLRNHGDSAHCESMDYHLLATDVAAFMDQQGLERVDVIGHSMGGKTAMRLALNDPHRIDRLMVVDIAPAPSGSDHDHLIDTLLTLPLAGMARRAEADEALAAHVTETGLRAFLLQNLKSDDGGLRWRINLEGLRRAMPALVDFPLSNGEQFPGETLFLRGGDSSYLRDEHLPVIHRHFPKSRIETIAGAGHWLHADKPARFLQCAQAFLDCDVESTP